MTAADLLTRMQVLKNELQIESGGDDETMCLAALDMAQDYFESVAASMPRIGQTASPLATVANTETTTWPSSLKRLDSLWYIDATTSRPAWQILPIADAGGHQPSHPFPLNLVMSPASGPPREYAYDSTYLYWRPLPDAVYAIRAYGLFSRTALTSRSVTFGWDDEVSVPLAGFAVKLLKMSVDDKAEEIAALAEETFVPVLRSLRKRVRQTAMSRHYTRVHTT